MAASTLKSPLTLESPSPQVSRIPSPYSPNSPMKTSDTTYRGDYASAYDYVMVSVNQSIIQLLIDVFTHSLVYLGAASCRR